MSLVAVLVFANGCALSVNPVVPESEATFDSALLGTWEEVDGSDRAVVSRGVGTTYAIAYTSDGKVTRLEARLGRLGEHVVLDVWPAADSAPSELSAGFAIPGHLIVKLDAGAGEARVALLEPDSLLAALRSQRVTVEYQYTGGRPILHGTTEQLRAALMPYLAQPGAFAPPDLYRRTGAPRASASLPNVASAPSSPVDIPCFEASAWREADRLFHRDPHWVGGDVASSVDLGGGRILWLFGDAWIDTTGTATRRGARMVSNSVAIQTGTDPSTAAIKFFWGTSADGKPAPIFPDSGNVSLWFGNGIRVGDRLVLFFSPTLRRPGVMLGFEHLGWTAVLIENPDAEPSAWRARRLEVPANPLGIHLGFAGVTRLGEYVYAFGSQNAMQSFPIYSARWLADDVRRGNLLRPEWWAGTRFGWVPDSSRVQRWPLFEQGKSELSIHFDSTIQRFIEVQTTSFGPSDLAIRAAPELTGPWTGPRMVYRPPEYYRPNATIYAGKAHPELTGADLVLTYVNSSFHWPDVLADRNTYFPRFVRLTRCGH